MKNIRHIPIIFVLLLGCGKARLNYVGKVHRGTGYEVSVPNDWIVKRGLEAVDLSATSPRSRCGVSHIGVNYAPTTDSVSPEAFFQNIIDGLKKRNEYIISDTRRVEIDGLDGMIIQYINHPKKTHHHVCYVVRGKTHYHVIVCTTAIGNAHDYFDKLNRKIVETMRFPDDDEVTLKPEPAPQ